MTDHHLSIQRSKASRLYPLLLMLALWSGDILAQEQAETPAIDEVPVETQSPLDAGEALREIEGLAARLDEGEQVAELRTRLELASERLSAEIEDRLRDTPMERIDRNRLGGLLLALSRQRSLLAGLRLEIGETIARVDALQDAFRQIEETWTRILDEAEDQDQPQELVELLRRVVDNAASGRQRANERLGELLQVETDALALRSQLESITAEAEARERALLADIFSQDQQPVWTVMGQLSIRDAAADLATLHEAVRDGLEDLAGSFRNRLLGQGAFGLLALFLLVSARRSEMFASRIEQGAAQRVLEHPFAVTIILTTAVTQALYPTAQPAVVALNTAVFIVAELVVLGAALQRISWKALALTGAYLIAIKAAFLLPFATPLHRLAILAGALGGIVLLAATWRICNTMSGFARWRAVVRLVLSILGILLVAAVIANLFGAVTLASFVVEAVVRCYLAALGLLTLSLVIPDFINIVLDTRLFRPVRSIQQSRGTLTRLIKKTVAALAVILWLVAALSAFRLLDPFFSVAQAVLGASWSVGQASISLGTVLVFILSVWLAVYVSRVTRFFLDADVLPRFDLPRGVPAAVSTGVHYLIIAGALLFGTMAAGLDLTKLAIVIGALSVGIGFGLQNIVNNFISGLILLFERPVQVGDQVQVGSLMGRISRIGIRASTVRMYEGSEVIVPNGDLISQQVINYTLSDRNRRMELIVGVAYGTDLEKGQAVIEDAVNSVPLVSEDPPAQVLFRGFGDSSIDFRVLFWVADFDVGLQTTSEVGIAINRALKREGIEIPFPQRDLHLRSPITVDAPEPKQST